MPAHLIIQPAFPIDMMYQMCRHPPARYDTVGFLFVAWHTELSYLRGLRLQMHQGTNVCSIVSCIALADLKERGSDLGAIDSRMLTIYV